MGVDSVVTLGSPVHLGLLVLPAVAAVLVLLRHRRRLQQQRALASPAVWQRLMGGAPATGLARMLLWCMAAALTALALARPQWGEARQEETVHTRDLVVALDVSDSMLCPDLQPSRLQRALVELRRSLSQLEGNRIGVVVFAGEAYPLVPLTGDLHAVSFFLDSVEPGMVALPGSNLERAVSAALELLPSEGQGRVVVLVSDGENLQGDPEKARQILQSSGVRLLAVMAGTPDGGPIPVPDEHGVTRYKIGKNGQPVLTRAQREGLEQLAAAGQGGVVHLDTQDLPRQLLRTVERLRSREQEMTRTVRRLDRFPLALMLAAACIAGGFAVSPWRRGMVLAALLVLVPLHGGCGWPAVPAAAAAPGPGAGPVDEQQSLLSPWPEPAWWQQLVPGGSRRLARSGLASWRRGDRSGAARDLVVALKLDPASPQRWYDAGAVLAASGNLQVALPLLREAHRLGAADAAYNLGTAALFEEQPELAAAWLRLALLASPTDPDVRRNYELALRLRARQQAGQQEDAAPPESSASPAQGAAAPPLPEPPAEATTRSIYAALERAEAAARKTMRDRRPPPQRVDEDW